MTAIFLVLNGMGYYTDGENFPKVDFRLLIKSPLEAGDASNAMRYSILIQALFGGMMLVNLPGLLAIYKFVPGGNTEAWVTMVFTFMASTLVIGAVTGAVLLSNSSADPKTTSDLVRWQWCFYSVVFGVTCIGNTINQQNQPDMPVEGQYFNLGLWFIGIALAFKHMTGGAHTARYHCNRNTLLYTIDQWSPISLVIPA
jgi:hypothetical protein